MKKAGGMLLKIAGVIAFLLVAFVAINLFDRRLNLEVAEMIDARPAPVPEDLNGYYALLGFGSGPGEDIWAMGRRIVDAHEAAASASPPAVSFSLDEVAGATVAEFVGDWDVICDFNEMACLPYYEALGESVTERVTDNSELIERYRSLYAYDYFQSPTTPTVLEPFTAIDVTIFLPLHGLMLAEIALRFLHGDQVAAVRDIEADILFWRRLVAGVESFSEKRDAFGFLSAEYAVLGEMMAVLGEASVEFEPDPMLFEPLSHQERSFERVWDRSLRSSAWALEADRWPLGALPGSEIPFLAQALSQEGRDAQRPTRRAEWMDRSLGDVPRGV